MPRVSLNQATTGMLTPSRWKTVALPKASSMAWLAAAHGGGNRCGVMAGGESGGAILHQFESDAGGDEGLQRGRSKASPICSAFWLGTKAASDFDAGAVGEDGFGAGALIAGGQAVDFEGGAGPFAFEGGEAGFAEEFFHAQFGGVLGIIVGEGFPHVALVFGEREDVIIEAGDGDAAVGIVKFGEHFAEGVGGIGDGAAVHAGVEVGLGAMQGKFQADQSAEAIGDRGDAVGEDIGVGDEEDLGGFERSLFGVDDGHQIGRADFLFALEEDGDAAGEALVDFFPGQEGGEVAVGLAFVIGSAAGEEVRFPERSAKTAVRSRVPAVRAAARRNGRR